jgi:hypothetical protein
MSGNFFQAQRMKLFYLDVVFVEQVFGGFFHEMLF